MTTGNHLVDALRTASAGRDDALFAERPGLSDVAYGELWRGAAATAEALLEAGLRPGDRVAAQVEKSVEAIQLYLGAVMAGGVFLPLNTGYTADEIGYFLGDAEPRGFVCDPKRRAALASAAETAGVGEVLTLASDGSGTLTERRGPGGCAPVGRGPDELAAILYTSGTTGRSKGAMLTHENLLSNSRALMETWRFTAEDRLIHALPIFHTHGLFVATNVTLLSGASCIFMPRFDAETIMAALPRATAMMGVPTFYTRLLERPDLGRAAAAGMRLFVSGSAPMLAETHRAWSERTGHDVLERYGMTETNMITSNPYEGERRPGAVGFALPGVEMRVADPETGRELPQGEIGGIEVRGPNVFRGYWRMPEKTAEEFRDDGFFVTGDLGTIDEDGYLHIVGRSKDLVISGGYNVYPKEVETLIDEFEGVKESAVIGLPHPDFGEGVAAVVVPEAGAALEERAILSALSERLARYKQPKRVFFVDELPRNAMGKVQKAELRKRYADVFTPGG